MFFVSEWFMDKRIKTLAFHWELIELFNRGCFSIMILDEVNSGLRDKLSTLSRQNSFFKS